MRTVILGKAKFFGYVGGVMEGCEIYIRLLSSKFNAFYHTYDYLDEGTMMEFLRDLDLKEFQSLIELAEEYGIAFSIRNTETCFLKR